MTNTDSHRVQLLNHDGRRPAQWLALHYTDLGPRAADDLAPALSNRFRPRPLRRLAHWFGSYRSRR